MSDIFEMPFLFWNFLDGPLFAIISGEGDDRSRSSSLRGVGQGSPSCIGGPLGVPGPRMPNVVTPFQPSARTLGMGKDQGKGETQSLWGLSRQTLPEGYKTSEWKAVLL